MQRERKDVGDRTGDQVNRNETGPSWSSWHPLKVSVDRVFGGNRMSWVTLHIKLSRGATPRRLVKCPVHHGLQQNTNLIVNQ
jgi:hypothetical protein